MFQSAELDKTSFILPPAIPVTESLLLSQPWVVLAVALLKAVTTPTISCVILLDVPTDSQAAQEPD